jgi:hypothetical protein
LVSVLLRKLAIPTKDLTHEQKVIDWFIGFRRGNAGYGFGIDVYGVALNLFRKVHFYY